MVLASRLIDSDKTVMQDKKIDITVTTDMDIKRDRTLIFKGNWNVYCR